MLHHPGGPMARAVMERKVFEIIEDEIMIVEDIYNQ